MSQHSPPFPSANSVPSATDGGADDPDGFRDEGQGPHLVVVGCGPRGLYCLERLAERLSKCPIPGLTVTIFEPATFPGAGNIYDPRQPDYLRMNFAARHINAWMPTLIRHPERPGLLEWLVERRGTSIDPEAFVPRAEVGAYLHQAAGQVLQMLRRHAVVHLCRDRVTDITRDAGAWAVSRQDEVIRADEVLLTVGHGGWRAAEWDLNDHPDVISSVIPVHHHLMEDRIPPGSQVAVRGFGLTAIDAVLALTEGRGGQFVKRGQRWDYERSGAEPNCILPFSRTGRPMLAKPMRLLPPTLEEIWHRGRAKLLKVPRPLNGQKFRSEIWPVVVSAAAEAMDEVEPFGPLERSCRTSKRPTSTVAEFDAWFQRWSGTTCSGSHCVDVIRRSHAVAIGKAPLDIPWALGEAWRKLYPAIVECVSHGGLAGDAWSEFRRIAVEMERIAFGPPAENLGRILALIECGLVDLRFVNATIAPTTHSRLQLSSGSSRRDVTRCVNAVLPSPYELSEIGPLRSLLQQNIIRRLHGTLGIEVDPAGQPVAASATSTDGLAILGRATEGCILGNDTLSRTLHPHTDHWADAVVKRFAASRVPHFSCSGSG